MALYSAWTDVVIVGCLLWGSDAVIICLLLVGFVSGKCCVHRSYVLELHWTCAGYALAVYWQSICRISFACWRCTGYVFAMYQ